MCFELIYVLLAVLELSRAWQVSGSRREEILSKLHLLCGWFFNALKVGSQC
uniref:Cyclin-B1-2-like n=1 Tax=Rhizophora mucronata TaxID=61149 RepID=A0A2P2P3W9_RHIMU